MAKLQAESYIGDTVAIARRYQAASRHEVIVQSEPDGGLYDAMNKGLQKATGDYVLFLNAGDRLHAADTLSMVAHATEDCEAGVIYGDTDIMDAEGNFLRHRRLSPPEKLKWQDFKKGMLVCHQAFFASVRLARECPYRMQFRYSADFDWCIRLMRLAEQRNFPLVNAHMVVADYLDGGMTVKNHRRSLLERLIIMSQHYGWVTTARMHLWFVVRAIIKK